MNFKNSLYYHNKAEKLIPVRTQTFSKGYKYFPPYVAPQYIDRGKGAYVWDVDDNKFTDYVLSLCPITLGYHYPVVDRAIKKQLDKGIIFSLSSPLEIELAELLRHIIPCAEMTRFFKTGSEATQAAIRIARAYTNREHIAFCGYHGWHDWIAGSTDRKSGISNCITTLIHKFEYNNIASLESILRDYDCAAIIMEPIVSQMPKDLFLQQIRELANRYKCVLIFDEIVTGFRIAINGAQGYFNVKPDLATFGKGMANGMPIACVCGCEPLMKEFERCMISSTFAGDLLSIAASIATINEMMKKDTISHIQKVGSFLMNNISASGYPARFIYSLPDESPESRTYFMQQMIMYGQLIHPTLAVNLCYSHTEKDIENFFYAFQISSIDLMRVLSMGNIKEKLKGGNVIEMAFRRTD